MSDTEEMTTTVYEQSLDAVVAQVNGQMVALDVSRGICFGLNGPATAIWDRLDGKMSVDAIVDNLIEVYDVERAECERQTHALLRDLSAKNLVKPSTRG